MLAAYSKIDRVESHWTHTGGFNFERWLRVYVNVPLTHEVASEIMAHIIDNLAVGVDADSPEHVVLVGPFNA